MGEYAFRKSDGVEIKIGTCESMYYLRYEQREMVDPQRGSLNPAVELGLFFRLPFPDEDAVLPGEFQPHSRGERLWSKEDLNCDTLELDVEPGTIQLRHDCGLLLNVPCHHGRKLPKDPPGGEAFWNEKTWHLELMHVKATAAGVLPVIGCRFCRRMWRCEWAEILPYIQNDELRRRLEQHRSTMAAQEVA